MNNILISIVFLTNIMNFEVAYTPQQRSLGMMYRTNWGEISGMLFIHDNPGTARYWMKNTPLNMVMIFMNSNLEIMQKEYPTPYSTDIVATTNDNIKFVLELDPLLENYIFSDFDIFQEKMRSQLKNYGFSFTDN